jgi:hypothetical protein
MNSAVIIFSDDNFFVRFTLMKLRDDHFDALIERSHDIEHFTSLIKEFITENITVVRIICDGNLALDVVFELEDLLDEYSDQIDFEYHRSVEESYDYYEDI